MRRPSILFRLALLVLAPLVAACTESIESGAACPDLCPTENAPVRDTVLDAIVLDSALSGFPLFGEPRFLLLASNPRPDTLDARTIVRFDSLPKRFFPVGGADSADITRVDSAFIVLHFDTTSKLITQSATITAYDVDTVTTADTSAAVLNALFRPDRAIGSLTVLADSLKSDSVRIPLSNEAIAAKANGQQRLRIGFRITSGSGARLRIQSSRGGTNSLAARLSFDPATDTTYRPLLVVQSSSTPGEPNLTAGLRDFTVVAAGTVPTGSTDLVVGGFPSRRTFLRFVVPSRFVDSSTIVRATLQLVQRPVLGIDKADTVQLQTDVVVAEQTVADLLRVSDLAAPGSAFGLDSLRLSPADSGARSISLVSVVRAWHALPSTTQRALVLRSTLEGAQAGALRFFSIEAAPALRPRLRLSYIPRNEFALRDDPARFPLAHRDECRRGRRALPDERRCRRTG